MGKNAFMETAPCTNAHLLTQSSEIGYKTCPRKGHQEWMLGLSTKSICISNSLNFLERLFLHEFLNQGFLSYGYIRS